MAKITILGAGGFGIALGVMCERHGHEVTLWTPFAQEAAALRASRVHEKLLAGVRIPEAVRITDALDDLPAQELVLIATPSFAVRETAARVAAAGILPGVPVACVSKGLEADSFKTFSDVIAEELPKNPNVIVSGPSHAEEVALGMATTVVAASRSRESAERVQDLLINESFRIYVGDDVLGVELGGALKNVIALAAGVLDGLGAGDNTKAALMTRGLAEISRLGVALGAKVETFSGLSGIGDLIVTCSSMHSRNRRCGMLIGQGRPAAEAVAEIGQTVEGYPCTKTAYELARKHRVEMPIVNEAYAVLYEGKPVERVVGDLMGRPKRHESEAVWLLLRNS